MRVLIVMARREEAIKGILLRCVGHFDDDLFEVIGRLNPDLKDLDHLEDGQLHQNTAAAPNPIGNFS